MPHASICRQEAGSHAPVAAKPGVLVNVGSIRLKHAGCLLNARRHKSQPTRKQRSRQQGSEGQFLHRSCAIKSDQISNIEISYNSGERVIGRTSFAVPFRDPQPRPRRLHRNCRPCPFLLPFLGENISWTMAMHKSSPHPRTVLDQRETIFAKIAISDF